MGPKPRGERKYPKEKTSTFLLELPLEVEAMQTARLRAHLEAGRQFYNAVLSAGQRRMDRQRRAANPMHYDERGRPKKRSKGAPPWKQRLPGHPAT
jgi:hypothetical protein